MHPNDFVMKRIDSIQAEQDAAFASDLGLKPGEWPAALEHAGVEWLKGQPKRSSAGELESVEYYRPGKRLTVFND